MKRFTAAVLAAIVFAIIYSSISYIPDSQREANVYYFGFFETFAFVLLYSGPVFLVIGIPVSILIDNIIERTTLHSAKVRYLKKMVVYSVTGLLAGTAFIFVLMPVYHPASIIFSYALMGFVAANIYYHLLLVMNKRRYRAE
ncbi:hypothetical protein [Sporosarcina cascadiensis]|uniref:hypothetical protein n=1 Tax=Sporosarcina cascadiensis TaxID=2660747 RepID=UPI00129B7D1D|nr:hypothetical protein [Sporosarcina cascadiensis]